MWSRAHGGAGGDKAGKVREGTMSPGYGNARMSRSSSDVVLESSVSLRQADSRMSTQAFREDESASPEQQPADITFESLLAPE